jgi:hypothetical protein
VVKKLSAWLRSVGTDADKYGSWWAVRWSDLTDDAKAIILIIGMVVIAIFA